MFVVVVPDCEVEMAVEIEVGDRDLSRDWAGVVEHRRGSRPRPGQSSTETPEAPSLPTAMSGRPSSLKSPTAMARGPVPTVWFVLGPEHEGAGWASAGRGWGRAASVTAGRKRRRMGGLRFSGGRSGKRWQDVREIDAVGARGV